MTPSARPSRTEADEVAAFLEGMGVAAGARLLDAPCGIGRRAHVLAEQGYRVTAVDVNPVAIEALRRRVPQGLQDRLRCRSATWETLPDLAADERFDVALCLDHAIGRGPREADVARLRRLREHTVPGGALLMDLLHRDFFAARPRPFAYHVLGGVEQHEFRTFDPVSGVLDLTWRFYRREGKDLRFQGVSAAHLRLLSPRELADLLEDAGWRVEAWHGGWGKEPISADRRKLVLVARAAARS